MVNLRKMGRAAGGAGCCAIFALSTLCAQTAPLHTPEQELTTLAESFTEAQHAFDVATLEKLTEPNYIEISPLGDVDPREKMLGFYAPEKKVDVPPAATLSELNIRVFGDAGVVLAKLHWQLPNRAVDLRTTFVAHHSAAGWRLVSVVYTGIRPPRSPSPAGS